MAKTKQEIIELFIQKPTYINMGAGKMAKRWNKTRREINECKQMAKDALGRSFKRLFFDIETSPNIGFFWNSGYKLNIPYSNIIQEKAIICVSYKWEHEDKVHHLIWNDGNDYELVKEFSKILFKADEVVAHFGDKFDIPWLRGRALYHRIPFPTYLKSLDTKQKAYSHFKLNSNSLDYLAKYLKVGGKIEDGGWQNWVDVVLHKKEEALKIMVDYCDNDVIILEDVFNVMQSYIKLNSHVGVNQGQSKSSCPCCGSTNTHYHKPWVTASGTIQRIMKCGDCGTDFKISNKEWLHITK